MYFDLHDIYKRLLNMLYEKKELNSTNYSEKFILYFEERCHLTMKIITVAGKLLMSEKGKI